MGKQPKPEQPMPQVGDTWRSDLHQQNVWINYASSESVNYTFGGGPGILTRTVDFRQGFTFVRSRRT